MRQQRLGDRMIAMIGLLVAAAVAALVGFAALVAYHVDRQSAARELELVRRGIVALEVKMRNDLAAFAHWDDVVGRIANGIDRAWVHRRYGARLWETSGHDRSFIIDSDGAPIYSSIDGIAVDSDLYRRVQSAVEPLIERVRLAYGMDMIAHALSEEKAEPALPGEPSFASAFRRIEGRPALIGVIAIVPHRNRADRSVETPSAAVSIAFFDERVLESFARELAVGRIGVHETPPAVGARLAVEIPLEAGDDPAWLVWTPEAPGAAMLNRLMPALFGVVALLGLIAVLVLTYVRRTAERLDHSERRATELAYRDRLTGLANRVQLMDTLGERLAEGRRGSRLALILIDFDDFKNINDTLGHPVGDEVLFAVGERLSSVVGEDGMAVRFGGDEFALLVPVGEGNDHVFALCRRVSESVRAPVMASGQFLAVSATIGVAVTPDDADEPEQLLRRAEIPLYRAKAESRGGWRLFDPGYEEALHKRSIVERELLRALASEELAVMYQPLYAVDGERIVGVEALVRWRHPERGVVPPSEFIPVAEQTGLVVRLDEWVLRRACEQAMQWPGLSLAVNLSASNFRQGNVAERLTRVLGETGFDPRRIEIEITESMLLGASGEVLGELSELRRLGVRIALDDFGTGYSSLGYLRRFPVDKLKIDKSFVQNLGITEDAAAIVECVTRLGRALGLAVTAEGVETGEQHRFVRAAGCHQVQGYLFSPPVEAARISELVLAEPMIRHRSGKVRFATV